jgi:hypothetical protein
MQADLDIYLLSAWRAVEEWRKTHVRPILDVQIDDLEVSLAAFTSGWLPVRWPKDGTPGRDHITPLLDGWGWPLKFQGAPVVRTYGSKFDEFTDALREFLGMQVSSAYDVVTTFANLLLEVKRLRGRGHRYGLLSRGACCNVATDLTGTPLTLDLVQGPSYVCASVLLRAAEIELSVIGDDCDTDLTRLVHARWCRRGAPDLQFRELLVDHEALDILMGHPSGQYVWFPPLRPKQIPSWRALTGVALGIISTQSAEGPVMGMTIAGLAA